MDPVQPQPAPARSPEPRRAHERVRASDLSSLIEVEAHASGCTLCRLCRDRTQVVTGSGPTNADVLVVTEAPGYHEDRAGEHLVGRTGERFDRVLALAGLRREQVFITSVVKCRPQSGRTPFPDEVEACEGWLFREISLVSPRVIVTLGALALRLVTGRAEQLSNAHGRLLNAQVRGRDVLVWPLVHPGAALHAARLGDQLEADARNLGALLAGARASTVSEPTTSTNVVVDTPAITPPTAPPTSTESDPDAQMTLEF